MTCGGTTDAVKGPGAWLRDAERIDAAVYAAIAEIPTPAIDRQMSRLTQAANYSRLWIGCSAILAATRGARGRRAAAAGLASVLVTSAVANLLLKPLGSRRRPDQGELSSERRAPMPAST